MSHLSGVSEYTDVLLEDLKEIRVLSEDGASTTHCLFALQPCSQENVMF